MPTNIDWTRKGLGSVLLVLAIAGCKLQAANSPRPTSPTRPAPEASAPIAGNPVNNPAVLAQATLTGQGAVTLTGKVKLLADAQGNLLGNNGGSIISDGGGSIVSDHASGVISNNAGSIIANNSSGLTSKVKRQLLDTPELAYFALADAEIVFADAAGKAVARTRTDAQGNYAFKADLAKGNYVARIQLWNGGTLAAILVSDGAGAYTLDLDLASTLGAVYVLERFVKGNQAIFDRLPRGEAERLQKELAVVHQRLGSAPSYDANGLVATTEALRSRVPAVNQVIEDVKALLLGQSNLGAGRKAIEVPLGQPGSLLPLPDGSLIIAEEFLGRLRVMKPDGTLETLLDSGSGKFHGNIARQLDSTRGPDGTLYFATYLTGLWRLDPAGVISKLATDKATLGGHDGMTASVAAAADGTLYMGEFTWKKSKVVPRVFAYAKDGSVKQLAIDAGWTNGTVVSLCVAPDGSLLVVHEVEYGPCSVYRYQDGKVTPLASGIDGGCRDILQTADGTIYLAQPGLNRIAILEANGSLRPFYERSEGGMQRPRALAQTADGTFYATDEATSQVYMRKPDDPRWVLVAGSQAIATSGDTTDFGLNQPLGLAFDANNDLYIVETGSSTVRRFRGGQLEPVVGKVDGLEPKGVPVAEAALSLPLWICENQGSFLLGDGHGITKFTPGGTIESVINSRGKAPVKQPGEEFPASEGLTGLSALAVDAKGRIYWSMGNGNQVRRYVPDAAGGKIQVLAGTFAGEEQSSAPERFVNKDATKPEGPLGYPIGGAIGPDGNYYFAEFFTGRVSRIVGLDSGGPVRIERVAGQDVMKTVANALQARGGVVPVAVDALENGNALETPLAFPMGLAFDKAGNLYIAEAGTIHIASLFATTLGGGGALTLDTSVASQLGLPKVAGRIRKVTPDGRTSIVAGHGSRFFPDEDGDNALILPGNVAVAPDGRLAIADIGANMVRILPPGSY